MHKLKDALKRWRNSRGFGVHSPFGYALTQRVVHIGKDYAYYAEKAITRYGKTVGKEEIEIVHAIKLHRFAAMIQAETVYHNGPISKLQRMAFEQAGCKIRHTGNVSPTEAITRPCILIGHKEEFSDDLIREFLCVPDNSLIIYSQDSNGTANKMMTLVNSGIVVEGINCVLAVGRKQTQPNLYKMNF